MTKQRSKKESLKKIFTILISLVISAGFIFFTVTVFNFKDFGYQFISGQNFKISIENDETITDLPDYVRKKLAFEVKITKTDFPNKGEETIIYYDNIFKSIITAFKGTFKSMDPGAYKVEIVPYDTDRSAGVVDLSQNLTLKKDTFTIEDNSILGFKDSIVSLEVSIDTSFGEIKELCDKYLDEDNNKIEEEVVIKKDEKMNEYSYEERFVKFNGQIIDISNILSYVTCDVPELFNSTISGETAKTLTFNNETINITFYNEKDHEVPYSESRIMEVDFTSNTNVLFSQNISFDDNIKDIVKIYNKPTNIYTAPISLLKYDDDSIKSKPKYSTHVYFTFNDNGLVFKLDKNYNIKMIGYVFSY